MTKTGWWNVKFELTLDGEEVRWDDLDEATQEHIADCIKEGYTGGEIVIEEDYDGAVFECPHCGKYVAVQFGEASCEECGWFCEGEELEDLLEEIFNED